LRAVVSFSPFFFEAVPPRLPAVKKTATGKKKSVGVFFAFIGRCFFLVNRYRFYGVSRSSTGIVFYGHCEERKAAISTKHETRLLYRD
jgi:hypothetical protein